MVAVPIKIGYFDCFSGISGDMCLGALVDAGVSLQGLKEELNKIPVSGYELKAKKVKKAGIVATKVDVIERSALRVQRSGGRKWKDIEKIIQNSSLSQEIKQKGLRVFKCLFEAEAKVHGKKINNLHLHELGDIDCIVDIFGTIIGLDMLGVEKVYSSPVNLGGGTINTHHGILPVPPPATAEILKGIPVYSSDIQSELTTPTGAAILKGLSGGFGDIPLMKIEKTGIGAGSKDFNDRPNVLRIFIGEMCRDESRKKGLEKSIIVIESNIDDMNPQIYEHVIERLFKEGALDVFLTPIIMKKGRPGIKLTVLCKDDDRDLLIKTILRETTTIGIRFYSVNRVILEREIKLLETEFGKVRIKVSKVGQDVFKVTPEYEDCKKIARKFNMPLIEVMKRINIALSNE
jgi:uncharacterized protein (TIGR00299 family) protein